jgi:LCP family protein required for cell wall assembly
MRSSGCRGWPVLALALAMLTAACSSGSAPETTTTSPTTLAPTTSATTTTTRPATTTTTIPFHALDIEMQGDDGAAVAVGDLYAWLGDRTLPQPDVPPGLIAHLEPIAPTESMTIDATLTTAEAFGGRVGVVTADDDVVLLADDGSGWKVVGAKLARFGSDPWYGGPVRHVLIIGTDARPGEGQQLYRADSIHIASSNLALHSGAVVGFPRDSYVDYSGGTDKFSSVNARSDRHAEEMVDVAQNLSGLPIEGYIITGFLGFEQMVNDFGGVMVNVPFAMAESHSQAYLSAGLQRLWGANALAFSRNRHLTGGDFTRSFHQGLVILAALRGATEESITDLPMLLEILSNHTWTNLPLGDLLTVAATAYEIDPDTVENIVLKGTVATIHGASVVLLDEDYMASVFEDLTDGVLTPES